MSMYDDVSQLYYCECGCGQPLSDWSYGIARGDRDILQMELQRELKVLSLSCKNKNKFKIFAYNEPYDFQIGCQK